jgi:hypothetical protein
MIPTLLKESFDRYVEYGIPTGDFLKSVLENDLMGAFGRADILNRVILFDICVYVYNELPRECHGSREAVKNWLARDWTEIRKKRNERNVTE